MIREILKMGDERLLRIAPPVPAEMFDSPELWQLIDDMFQTMESVGGVGLAAPQIGIDLQLVIFGFEHSERYPDAEAVRAIDADRVCRGRDACTVAVVLEIDRAERASHGRAQRLTHR